MKCPMQKLLKQVEETTQVVDFFDCLKEQCEWWDTNLEECDPTGLKAIMIAIGNTLGKIADGMLAE